MKMFHRCVSDYQESVSECVSESKEGFRYVSESDTPILIIERSELDHKLSELLGNFM